MLELEIKLTIFGSSFYFPNRYVPYLKVLLSNKFGGAFFSLLADKKKDVFALEYISCSFCFFKKI